MRDACDAAVAPVDRRLFEAGWLGCGRVWDPHRLMWAGLEVGRHKGGADLMRDACDAAVAPVDRRLFEAGWLGYGRVWDPHRLMWAGLEVGRHKAEQF